MAIKATMEILGTRMWDMVPELLHHYKQTVDSNLLLHAHFDNDESERGIPYFMSSSSGFEEKIYVGNAVRINRWYGEEMDHTDIIVNVVPVEGPILRNGDACSYGSKEYRDWLMAAADVTACVGHLIYIDTPGGSAFAKNDFQFAIDYVRSKNQPVIALVDGLCASAGMALAAMCDEIYFVNPMDRIGSIGTMCAFYATPDGVEDAVTHERFVEVYGSKSEFKNKEYRDAALGNYDELQAEVDDLNEQFWNVIKSYRPQVLEEQMHGKVYNCGDVVGTLVDGQGTMQSCIDRIMELAGVQAGTVPDGNGDGNAPATTDNASESVGQADGFMQDLTVEDSSEVLADESQKTIVETNQEINKPEDETTEEPVVPRSSEEVPASQNKEKEMKEYPLIMSALGLNALAVDKEGGYYMNEALCDAFEAFVAQANQNKLTMDAKIQEVAQLNARIEELKVEHEQAINGLNDTHAQEIEALNSDHAKALQKITEQKDGEIDELNKKVSESQKTIEGLNAQMEEKEAEIQEISEAVVDPKMPEAPTSDGLQTVEAPSFECKSVINDNMTPEEKKEALRKRNEELAKLIG